MFPVLYQLHGVVSKILILSDELEPFAIALLCVHIHAEKGLIIDYAMFIVSPGFFPILDPS